MRLHGMGVFAVLALTACTAAVDAPPAGTPPAGGAHEPPTSAAPTDRQLLADREVSSTYTGDLDLDGEPDRLVVTTPVPPADSSAPRGIAILVRRGTGSQIAARNDRAIPCPICGGGMGDPLAGIDLMPGSFVLRFEGGSRELWSATYRFEYEASAARWMLKSVDRKVLDRATGATRSAHASTGEIGRLDFTDFDPADDSLAGID